MMKTREEMVERFRKFVTASGCPCEVEHGENGDIILRMGFRLNNAVSTADLVIVAEEFGFRSYGSIGNNAGNKTAEVGEFLARASTNDVGHFSLDYDTGEISYVFYAPYCVFVEDSDFEALAIPVKRFAAFGDALLKVILGCSGPKAAFEDCVNELLAKKEEEH